MKIVNLTPHAVNIVAADGTPLITIDPSGTVARLDTNVDIIGTVDVGNVSIPVQTTKFGPVSGLPNPKDGTVYVVSSLVAQRVPDRNDVYVPTDTVRDANGRIVGCRALGRI